MQKQQIPLCADTIRQSSGVPTEIFSRVDSTNTEAKRRITAGADGTFLIAAEEQTAGRGRQGKAFFSPRGSGIYMTLTVFPNVPLTDAVSVTTKASVAVCRAIRRLTDKEPEIKWVNDILLDGKKICGILVEAVTAGKKPALVIGVGMNVCGTEFPPELPDAGALNAELDRNELIAAITQELLRELSDLKNADYLEDYRAWSAVLGREVRYLKNGTAYSGKAVRIEADGGLCVELPNGRSETLRSGEISLHLNQSFSVRETGQ